MCDMGYEKASWHHHYLLKHMMAVSLFVPNDTVFNKTKSSMLIFVIYLKLFDYCTTVSLQFEFDAFKKTLRYVEIFTQF